MNILVIDGQGGRMGKAIIEQLVVALPGAEIIAVGTNSIATAAMLHAGATAGATGENPVVVNAKAADFIVGPTGILAADSLLGEVTPAMALAVGQSPAQKVLLPVSRCHVHVVGTAETPLAAQVKQAVDYITQCINKAK